MLLSLPYLFNIHCIEKRKRKASRYTARSELSVLAQEITAADAPEVGFTQVGELKRLYRFYEGHLYVHGTYPDGSFVRAADFQNLMDRMPWPRDHREWNYEDFLALSRAGFSALGHTGNTRFDSLKIRHLIWDERLEQEAVAASIYRNSVLNMDGLILFRVNEPSWVIERRPNGHWQVELELGAIGSSGRTFLASELHSAHEFVRLIADVEMTPPVEVAELGGLKRQDGAALRWISWDILKVFLGKEREKFLSSPTSLWIEMAAAEIERHPHWLSTPSPYQDDEILRQRWMFEWKRLEKDPWWIEHRRSSEELADLDF